MFVRSFMWAVALPAIAPVGAAEIPWPEGAAAHYRVEISHDFPTNDVSPVCGVRFFSGGLLASGSQNVRVTDSKGKPLPLQIVYTHPVNASLVLFPVQPGEETYRLFFGGTVTPGAAAAEFNRGLFYEVRARPEGDSSSWDSIRKLWAAGTNSLGIAVVEDLVTRGNPFDESDNQFMSRTFGAFRTPREDVYKFGVFARDQGFFSVNGQPVASTVEDPSVRTQPISDALLPRGILQAEILQAKLAGQGATGVSWLVPWTEYYGGNLAARPVASAWHPPIVGSLVRDYEVRNQPFYACFNDFQSDMLLANEQPVVLVRFNNRTGGRTAGLAYQWDFGDGATSTEIDPQHVYVKPGRYVVTLTAGGASRFSKVVLATSFSSLPSQKIPMYESVCPWAAAEMIRLATPFLDKYDAGALWTLVALAEKIPDRKARAETVMKLGSLCLARSGTMTTQVEMAIRGKLAEARADLGQWDAAVADLKQMEPRLEKQRTFRTKLRFQIGKLYQRGLKNAQAIEVYSQIAADKGGDDLKMERTARIAIGDTYLQQGDVGAARKAYEQAAQVELGDGRTERERAIRRGSEYSTLRQTIGELSKLGLDTIGSRENVKALVDRARTSFENLAFEFPDARLNPDVLYLNAGFLLATGDEEGCVAELKTLAKVEPSGRYSLRSMILQARACMANKEYEKALVLLEAVLKSTRDDPLVKEATALKTLATDANASKAQFAGVARRYWPHNLFPDPSFETATIAPDKPLPFQVEWVAPVISQSESRFEMTLEKGFGTDGRRCLRIELLRAVPSPCQLIIRFPTALGDRLFGRCRVLCTDADFRLLELRRSSAQSDSVYSIVGAAPIALQQWGWLESAVNVEPWRQFSWQTGAATTGEPSGCMSFYAFALSGRTAIPAGTKIYIDGIEAYLTP